MADRYTTRRVRVLNTKQSEMLYYNLLPRSLVKLGPAGGQSKGSMYTATFNSGLDFLYLVFNKWYHFFVYNEKRLTYNRSTTDQLNQIVQPSPSQAEYSGLLAAAI